MLMFLIIYSTSILTNRVPEMSLTLLLTRIHINFSSMFGQAAAAAIQAKKDEEGANADDDEEEPPKEEIKQVVEDDAIHSVR